MARWSMQTRGWALKASVGLVVLGVASHSAFAQIAKPKSPALAAPAPSAAATPAPAPMAGPAAAPVVATAAPGPASAKVVRTENLAVDNWAVNCAETDAPDAKMRCSAVLKIVQTQDNAQRVVFSSIMAMQDGKPVTDFSVPANVQFAPGVEVKVGDKLDKKIGYALCLPDHCESVLPMEDAVVQALAGAPTADILITTATGQNVKYTANLKGFDKAFGDVNR
jgi:invasion protein IalB